MTHCRYALETLHLAIDYVYGTKKAEILTPTWVADHFKKPQSPKAKKAKTKGKKSKGAKAKKASLSSVDLCPF